MSDSPDAEAKWEEAHAELSRAISAYYTATTGEYCEAWALVTHKRSPELEQQGSSAVGVLAARDQSWVLTRGLLEIAREHQNFTGYSEDE